MSVPSILSINPLFLMKYFIVFFLLFVSLVSAQTTKKDLATFNDSSESWFRSQNDIFSVYSKNKLLSSHLNKISLEILNKITNEFLLSIPENLEIEIYVHKNVNDMSSYIASHLKENLADYKLNRWKKDNTLMSYQLDAKNQFRSKLINNDIPYLITLAYLNAADKDDNIPETLKIGMALSIENNSTNTIKNYINPDETFWINQAELFKFKSFDLDEELYLNKISGTSLAWVLYLKENCSKEVFKKAILEIINGKNIDVTFGEILKLGKYDVLPRLEEKIKKFLVDTFFQEETSIKSSTINFRPIISKALPALIIIILILVVLIWIKRSIL